MEGRRSHRRNHRRNNNPFGGPLPIFGISIFAVTNDPVPDELVSDNEEDVNDVEKKKAITLKQRIASFSDPTKFCRICLSCDKKLYAIPPQNRAAFRHVLNKDIEEGIPIPQRICVDCNAKMTTFATFRTRSLQTNSLLYTIIRPYGEDDEPPYGPATPRRVGHRSGSIQSNLKSSDENIPYKSRRISFCSQPGTPHDEPRPGY